MAWINLHAHSEYSVVNGQDGAIGNPLERVERAKELDQKALSITDHGTLIGVPEHIEACNKLGVKPIVGVEAYFKPDRLQQDKDHVKRWHLPLIAKNEVGWKNL